MKRCIFLLFLLVFIFTSSFSLAQTEIGVRGYEREDYSRLVFELQGDVTSVSDLYTLENKKNGEMHITFKVNQDNVEIKNVEAIKLKNVGRVRKENQNPQTVIFNVPKSSKVRDFTIGQRILIDIYAPENVADLELMKAQSLKEEKSKVKTAEKKQVENTQDLKKPASVEIKETTTSPNTPDTPNSKTNADLNNQEAKIKLVPVEDKGAIEKTESKQKKEVEREAEKQETTKKDELEKATKQETHIISFRSTNSFPMSVFENFEEIWFVLGDTKSYIIPGITSPTPEIFQGFDRIETEKAVIYKMQKPDKDLNIKAKGGFLSWDIVLSTDMEDAEPIKARRNLERSSTTYNGSYLWPLSSITDIIDIEDPDTGRQLKTVLVNSAVQHTGQFQSFAEYDVLTSYVGMVVNPKIDDLSVTQTTEGVEISRTSGLLSVAPQQEVTASKIFFSRHKNKASEDAKGTRKADVSKQIGKRPSEKETKNAGNLFKFETWKLDSATALNKKENTLLAALKTKEPSQRVEDILTLGKMMLSHTRGAEALGYFDYAADELPAIKDSAEFRALRGAARAFDWKSEAALTDLIHPDLKDNDEARMWRSYVLADLGDWNQAAGALPANYKALYVYPYSIAHRLALGLAEVNLRDGNVRQADELLGFVAEKQDRLNSSAKAYYDYLRGESFRQKGNEGRAEEIWKELTQSKDDLFRTKSGLALTILLANQGKIDAEETIDRLERLRYAWRGDELEANVNYWLGDAYFQEKKYIKGLSIMRDAASLAENDVLAQRITTDMTKTFTSMYLSPTLKNISALDAVAVYEEFSELTPPGDQGNKLVQMLAEHLVDADLLGRASKLLQYQVDHRLQGKEKLKIAVRLAAIELLDKNPQKAVNALVKAEATLRRLSNSPENQAVQREIDLLRIRAYSQNKQYNRAMSLIEKLPQSANVSRLKADVAWQAGYWDQAASALNEVIVEEQITEQQTLNEDQAALILNRAIALNLSGDRIGLANMRTKYGTLMQQTTKANQFELITRAQKSGILADRETLMSAVSEVDMFKDFLESYRNQN